MVEVGDTATIRCNWLKDGQRIDFDAEPRFIQANNSLTITQTTKMDSGSYTCQAKTILIVQDLPNPPNLQWVECNSKHATLGWRWGPQRDINAPDAILNYKIQYNTTFLPDTWVTAEGQTSKKHIVSIIL